MVSTRKLCPHGYFTQNVCLNADRYGKCCMTGSDGELPSAIYCDAATSGESTKQKNI